MKLVPIIVAVNTALAIMCLCGGITLSKRRIEQVLRAKLAERPAASMSRKTTANNQEQASEVAILKIDKTGVELAPFPCLAGLSLSTGFSQEQASMLEKLLVAHRENLAIFAAIDGPTGDDPRSVSETQQSIIDTIFSEAQTIVGDAGARQLIFAIRTGELRQAVNWLAGALYYTDNPLSISVRDQLLNILVDSSGLRQDGPIRANLQMVDWNRVLKQSQQLLSKEQLSGLTAVASKATFDKQYRDLTGFPASARLSGL